MSLRSELKDNFCAVVWGCRNVLYLNYLLDIFIMLAELFVIEPKLIHKVGGHLLDLIVGEGLRGTKETF